jgi:hypothetical protein
MILEESQHFYREKKEKSSKFTFMFLKSTSNSMANDISQPTKNVTIK